MNTRLKEELEKIKEMSAKQKLSYLWDYYKGVIIAPLIIVFLIWVVLVNFTQEDKEIVLYGVIIGNNIGMEAEEILQNNIEEYLELDTDEKKVIIDSSMELAIGEDFADEVAQMNMAKITAYVSGHELDFIIGEKEVIEHYNSLGALENIKDYIYEDGSKVTDKLDVVFSNSKRLLVAKDKNSEEIPCAVLLDKPEMTGEKQMYLAVIKTNEHDKEVKEFIKFALE